MPMPADGDVLRLTIINIFDLKLDLGAFHRCNFLNLFLNKLEINIDRFDVISRNPT